MEERRARLGSQFPHGSGLIEAESISKRFRDRHAVVGVSFAIARGTVAGLLGVNGAGKSTTMRLLAGYLVPDRGRAAIAGHDTIAAAIAARAALGYLPEAPSGFPHLTVREFLGFAAECRGFAGVRRQRAVGRAAEVLDLGPALDRTLGALSKGWRQRAWLAQAILHDPPVLLLDEPADGLDPGQRAQFRQYVRSIAACRAVLMSTHILEEAGVMCDRLIVMHAGRVVADGPTSGFLDEQGRLGPAFARMTGAGEMRISETGIAETGIAETGVGA